MNERALLNELSYELEKFQEKSPSKFNARCPVCGDSKKNKSKKRFWILENNGSFLVHCFNCGYSTSLRNFAKTYYPVIYNKFAIDFFKNKNKEFVKTITPKDKDSKSKSDILKSLLKHSSENVDIIKYLDSRKIPKSKQNLFYYIEDFSQISDKFEKFKETTFRAEPRLVLPIYNSNGDIIAIISRGLTKKSLRYINLKFVDEVALFGLYDSEGKLSLDFNKPVYVVEGPIDSLFLDNCVAASTSSLTLVKDALDKSFPAKIEYIFICDNDKRNKEIIDILKNIIDGGEKVVIFPNNITEKDINDMAKNNIDIFSLIKSNTFKGPRASLEFNRWKKL